MSALEKVRERMRRAAQALAAAGIPYAVAGGNAVAAWVGEVDEAAVRNTQDVDILLPWEAGFKSCSTIPRGETANVGAYTSSPKSSSGKSTGVPSSALRATASVNSM